MILRINFFKEDKNSVKTGSLVPIAFPLIAGAGTITSLVSLRAEYVVMAIIVNIILVCAVLKLSVFIERILNKGGIADLRKVFGIILLTIAVKSFRTNIRF